MAMSLSAVCVVLAALAVGGQPASAGTILYQETALTGGSTQFNSEEIDLQEVLIPSALNPMNLPAFTITKVTYQIHLTQTSCCTFSAYWADAGTDAKGTPVPDPSQSLNRPHLFYSQGVSGGINPTDLLITIGDGITPLFTVKQNSGVVAGYDLIWLGLSFPPVASNIAWDNASGPDFSRGVTYNYDLFTETQSFGTAGRFYLHVEGFPTPEPGSLTLLSAGLMSLLAIRRIYRRRART